MLDTPSLFDAMELDNTEHRIASRRALALAHNRVERNLGRFLRAAQSEEEFFERLALVTDEFDGMISTAAAEVGHAHPEHIAAALKDHYRLAADKVEFAKTPAEEQEEADKDQDQVVSASQIKPKQAKKALKKMAKAGRTWSKVSDINIKHPGQLHRDLGVPQDEKIPGDKLEEAEHSSDPKERQRAQFAENAKHWHGAEGKQGSPLAKEALVPPDSRDEGLSDWWDGYNEGEGETCPHCGSNVLHPETGQCMNCGHDPYGLHDDPSLYGGGRIMARVAQDTLDSLKQEYEDLMRQGRVEEAQRVLAERDRILLPQKSLEAPDVPPHVGKTADMYTKQEKPSDEVTCPECGGDGKTAGATQCGKCHGKGKVPNFGDSVLDAYFGRTADTDQNNTDLDGPEPKMDKRLWTPSNPGKPNYEDGSRHPTKQKDMTEVIGPMRNDHPLQEIHGQGTHFKEEKLPTQDGDDVFSPDGPSGVPKEGPHTDTWGNDGQVDPVTRQTLESVQSKADDPATNPLTELLESEWPSPQAVTAAFLQ